VWNNQQPMAIPVTPAEQPALAESAWTGPRGLLKALIRQGLDPEALKYAAMLVAELDRGTK
jgi:hypothetical protein